MEQTKNEIYRELIDLGYGEIWTNFSAQCPEIKQSAIERIKEDMQNHLCDIIVANHLDTI